MLCAMPSDRRPAYVTSVSQVAAPGATLLLYGFTRPPKAAPMHAGISTDEVRHRFSPAGMPSGQPLGHGSWRSRAEVALSARR